MPKGGARPGAGRKPGKKQQLPATEAKALKSIDFPAHQAPGDAHDTRFQAGQSGNPAGRPAAGASIREWINILAAAGISEAGLRATARNKKLPWPKRAAALRILRTLETPDLADFESLTDGSKSLLQMREEGQNTELVKKLKVTTRTRTEGEELVTEVVREVELFDRSGEDFDRIVEQTDGRPRQTVGVQQEGKLDVLIEVLGMDGAEKEAEKAKEVHG